jgi:hypothetical protein
MISPRGLVRSSVATIFACVLMTVGFSGCGGGSSTSPAPPVSNVAVALTPGSATVKASQATSFTATVTNDPKDAGTTWTLSGAGCTAAACGTLSGTTAASGAAVMFTAPAAVPNPPTVTLTATSVDDVTKSAKATITLTAGSGGSAIVVVVAPSMASVAAGGTATFAATLQNDTANKGVNWTLSGSSCTGSACGTVSPASSASGASVTYTAPGAVPTGTITLTATSVADTSKSASASIALNAGLSPTVAVTPGTANLPTGGVTQTFTANVANDPLNLGVAWSISGTNCTGAACGAIAPTTSASGTAVTYTSAARAAASGTVTVTASSVAEASSIGSAAVTLSAPQSPTATTPINFSPVAVGNGYGIPAIALDSAGNIDEAWINPDGVHFTRSTDKGAHFSSPLLIPSDLSQNSQNNLLSMVVDPVGNIDLLWYRVISGPVTSVGYNISRSEDNGATFTTPLQFTSGPQPSGTSNLPIIVGRPNGELVITWIDDSSNVLAETTTDGKTLSGPTSIALAVPGASGEKAVVGPAGQVYLFWANAPSATNCSISFSSSSDAVTYTAAKTISGGSGACNSQPAASVDSTDAISVTWVADSTSLFFSRTPSGGTTFTAPIKITTLANPTGDEVIAGADGGIYVLWTAGGAAQFASSQNAGVSFSASTTPVAVSITGGPPSFAVDACSNVTILGGTGAVDTTYQRSNDGGVTFSAPVDISDSQSHQDFEQQLAADKFGNVNFTWAVDGPQQVVYSRLPTVCNVQ